MISIVFISHISIVMVYPYRNVVHTVFVPTGHSAFMCFLALMILNDLNRRYACKLFDTTKKISTDDIITIKEALRLTSSSFGLQPWKFIIVSDDAIKQQLFAATTQNQIATCSHLVVLCGTNDIDDAHVDAFVASMVAHGGDAEKLAGYGQVMKNVMQSNRDAGAMREYIDDQVYIAL